MITAYLLLSAVVTAIGRLGNMFGRKRLLIIVMTLALVGSLISAVAPTLKVVIVGRAVQGVSIAILLLCKSLIQEHLPDRYLLTYVGGGYLTDYFDWRTMFNASTIFAAIAWTSPR